MTRTALFEQHQYLVRPLAHSVRIPGLDFEDVRQEARLALWLAAGTFDPERSPSFPAFATMCIRRRLWTLLKLATAQRRHPANDGPRLIFEREDGWMHITDSIPGGEDPADVVIRREDWARIVHAAGKLSPLERRALQLVVAEGVPVSSDKVLDNAIQRVRRKLKEAA